MPELSDVEVFGNGKELSDSEVFGRGELTDADVFGRPDELSMAASRAPAFFPGREGEGGLYTPRVDPAMRVPELSTDLSPLTAPLVPVRKAFGAVGEQLKSIAETHRKEHGVDMGALPALTVPAGVVAGIEKVAGGAADFMMSPLGLATAGLGAAPGAVRALASTAFAADMVSHAPDAWQKYWEAAYAGDRGAQAEALTEGLATLGMAGLAGSHGYHEAHQAIVPAAARLARALDRTEPMPGAGAAQPEPVTFEVAAPVAGERFNFEQARAARVSRADLQQPAAELVDQEVPAVVEPVATKAHETPAGNMPERLLETQRAVIQADKALEQRQAEDVPATTHFDPAAIPTVELPIKDIRLSKDVPNFKADADPETGVVAGQQLEGKFERLGTPPIVVWRRSSGDLEVITGRHRLDLARRSGEKTIPTQIVDEAAGFTREKAMVFDAAANIRDGQGSIEDYADFFRNTQQLTPAEAGAQGLLGRAKGRAGWDIGRSASDDLYALYKAGKVNEGQTLAIARAAPADAGAQRIGIKYALAGKSADFIGNVLKAAQSEAGQRGETLDLFGTDDDAMRQMEARAERAAAAQKEIIEQIRAVQGAAKRPEAARKLGVDVGDPDGVRRRVDELKAEAVRWVNWPLHPDLVERVTGKAAGGGGETLQLSAPESVEEQRARLEREAQAAGAAAEQRASEERTATAKRKMFEKAAAPLGGDLGSAGQGGLFVEPGQQEIFQTRPKGTSGMGRPVAGLPAPPPGTATGVHASTGLPVHMDRTLPGRIDNPTVMAALENVMRAIGSQVPIRTGRFYQRALGIYKSFVETIRLRQADDIPTAAHEVAHAFSDVIFGSPLSRPLIAAVGNKAVVKELRALGKALYGNRQPVAGYTAEGLSELTRLWLTTEDAAKQAPAATAWFENTLLAAHPEMAEALSAAREKIDLWRGQGAKGRAQAQMQGPPGAVARLKAAARKFLGTQAQIEEFEPLRELSEGFAKTAGRRLAPAADPFLLASAKRGSAGAVMDTMVERGMVDVWGNITGPGLKEALARVKPAEAQDFALYLWSRRALERWALGKNPGMAREDAVHLRTALETPAFVDAANKWYRWWDGILQYVKDANPAGNGPLIEAIRKGSHDYVPLARVLDPLRTKGESAHGTGGGLQRMHGSGLPIRDIYQQSLLVAEKMISKAHKDMVLEAVFKLSREEGMGWLVEKVPRARVMESVNIEKIRQQLEAAGVDTSAIAADELLQFASHQDAPRGSDPIMVRETPTGPEWYQVPARVYDLLQGLDPARLGPVADLFLAAPNRLFKLGTTGLRASFSLVTNPIRDFPTFMLQSIHGNPAARAGAYVHSLFDIMRAGLTGKEPAEWAAFKRLGVQGGMFLGGDVQHARREARTLFRGKFMRRVASPVEALRDALSFTEAVPRLAELRLAGKELGWTPGTPMTPNQAIAMSLAAKRITTDFSAAGDQGKMWNQVMPFYNASIQGTRAFLRAFKRGQGLRDVPHAALFTVLKGVSLLTVPVLYNWWRNKDKEWYRQLPWRERYLYTNVEGPGGEVVQVPRPPEWGNAFMVLPEMLFDTWHAHDPESARRGLEHIFETQNPVQLPSVFETAKQQWENEISFFNRPIVPRSEIDLPPGEQRAYFSSKLAVGLGNAFPSQVSPRRVDAAVRSLAGGLGGDVMDAPGQLMRALGIEEADRGAEPADWPIAGRLFRRGGQFSANNQVLADFWDAYTRSQSELQAQHRHDREGTTALSTVDFERARLLSRYHAVVKLELEIAARTKDPEARRKLYQSAAQSAREGLGVQAPAAR